MSRSRGQKCKKCFFLQLSSQKSLQLMQNEDHDDDCHSMLHMSQSCTTLDLIPMVESGWVGSENLQERAGRVGSSLARG